MILVGSYERLSVLVGRVPSVDPCGVFGFLTLSAHLPLVLEESCWRLHLLLLFLGEYWRGVVGRLLTRGDLCSNNVDQI